MSVCNFVELITPDTCIGDSLATINKNFQALDEGLCNVPDIVPGIGTVVEPIEVSEQMHGTVKVSTNNSFVYNTKFDSLIGAASAVNLPLINGTTFPATVFPYVTAGNIPLGTFSAISLTNNLPKITFFWTASGLDATTVYTTNSAVSSASLNFDRPITAMLSSGKFVYVGGDFITVAGKEVKKFCILDLDSGINGKEKGITLGRSATLVGSSLSANGGFGYNGEIKTIAESGDLLFFGGSYDSLLVGRGFTVYDRYTGQIYPFYVNGEINSISVNGPYVFIGGSFDYINYGSMSSSKTLGTRVYTNGLAKLSIPKITTFPNNSIDTEFAQNVKKQFNNLATINTIATKNSTVYIGGNFQSFQNNELYAENLAIVNFDGLTSATWRPIVTGEVFKLFVTGDYLYLGGTIKAVHTYADYVASPRKFQPFYHAACFLVSVAPAPILQTNWKPMFNGPVTNFACNDGFFSTPIYCYGMFTEVNAHPSNYIAAVEKSFENSIGGKDLYDAWRVDLQSPPKKINQSIFKAPTGLILGGNFTEINGKSRKYLARINGAYESLFDTAQSVVVLGIGGKICNPGSNLNINLTNYYTVTAYATTYGNVNQSTVPPNITSSILNTGAPGALYRFFVNRPLGSGTLRRDVNIIGWKIDFN